MTAAKRSLKSKHGKILLNVDVDDDDNDNDDDDDDDDEAAADFFRVRFVPAAFDATDASECQSR